MENPVERSYITELTHYDPPIDFALSLNQSERVYRLWITALLEPIIRLIGITYFRSPPLSSKSVHNVHSMFPYDKEGDTLRAGYVSHVRTVDRFRKVRKLKIWATWNGKAGFHVGNFGPKSVLDSRVMGDARGGGVSNLNF